MISPLWSIPRIGLLPSGPNNAITDVAGVTVGHHTVAQAALQTGVSVIRPHGADPYLDKVPAAVTVLNGFGKSTVLVQVEELGVLEFPIALTNTFGVGIVANAQIRRALLRQLRDRSRLAHGEPAGIRMQ